MNRAMTSTDFPSYYFYSELPQNPFGSRWEYKLVLQEVLHGGTFRVKLASAGLEPELETENKPKLVL